MGEGKFLLEGMAPAPRDLSEISTFAIPTLRTFFVLTCFLSLLLPNVIADNGLASEYLVQIYPMRTEIVEGESVMVRVSVYRRSYEGPNQGVSGAVIYLAVTHGTYQPQSRVTDASGRCTFTYFAPDGLSQPLSANLTAIGNIGEVLLPAASYQIHVALAPNLEVQLDGPLQVQVGGPPVNYTVSVSCEGEPVRMAEFTPSATAGGIGQQSDWTNGSGGAKFEYLPSENYTGPLDLTVRAYKGGYQDGYGYKTIVLVHAIGPLEAELSTDRPFCKSWASLLLTCNVTRAGFPVENAAIDWEANEGWLNASRTNTNHSGLSSIIYTATADQEGPWSGNVTITAHVDYPGEQADAQYVFQVLGQELDWQANVGCRFNHAQLFPGEIFQVKPSYYVPHGTSDFVAGMAVDFIVKQPSGEEYVTVNLAENLRVRDGLSWYPGWSEVLTVPDGVTAGDYPWDIVVTSPNRVHVYGRLSPHPDLNLNPTGIDDWTILMYINGDNDLTSYYDQLVDLLESEAPDGEFRVLLQYDRKPQNDGHETSYGAIRAELMPNPANDRFDSPVLGRLSSVDSGDRQTLKDFMMWGSHYAPAGHYCLVISDHGGAFEGVSYDYSCQSVIAPTEIASMFSRHTVFSPFNFDAARRDLDVMVFDACSMSSMEASYYFGNGARYLVASTTVMVWPGLYTPGALENLRSFYDTFDSSPTPLQLASDFIAACDQYWIQRDFPACVIDLEKANDTIYAFNDLCEFLVDHWSFFGDGVNEAIEDTQRLRGPSEGAWWLMDLGTMVQNIKDELMSYVIDPVGYLAVQHADEVLDKLDEAVVNYIPVEGITGLNLFVPHSRSLWEEEKDSYEMSKIMWGHAWCRLLDTLWILPHDTTGESEEEFVPLEQVQPTIIDQNDDGNGDIVAVNFPKEMENPANQFVVVDLIGQGSRLSTSSLYNLSSRSVLRLGPGLQETETAFLRPGEEGFHTLMVSIVSDDGRIVNQGFLANATLKPVEDNNTDPELSISAQPRAVKAGESVEFTASVHDPDGDRVQLWWDFDDRDGISIDSTNATENRFYLSPGRITVTCIASDGSTAVVDTLDLNVTPAVDNTEPFANMTAVLDEVRTVLINASSSFDPDGDQMEYRFSFGDGFFSGWQASPVMLHSYPKSSNYTCSLKVRDLRGGESDRVFLTVDSGGPVRNHRPQAELSMPVNEVGTLTEVFANGSTSRDRDSDELEYLFDWGDGNATIWGSESSASHCYSHLGNFTVTLSVRDPAGLRDSDTRVLRVEEAPKTPICLAFMISFALFIGTNIPPTSETPLTEKVHFSRLLEIGELEKITYRTGP